MHVVADDLSEMLDRSRATATAQWASWARALADGGDPPAGEELLVAAASLGIPMPAEALAADARALKEMETLQERLAGREAWRAERLAPWGDHRKLKQTIADTRAELERLERIEKSVGWDTRAATLKRQIIELRAKHARVFPAGGAAATPEPARARRVAGSRKRST